MIKFAYTILYVSDVEKSVAFYEKAFQFTTKFISPDSTYAELITGETTLSFAHKSLAASNLPEGFRKVVFRLNLSLLKLALLPMMLKLWYNNP
jgi:predicted enzyme related to lactoylglutathione lyase